MTEKDLNEYHSIFTNHEVNCFVLSDLLSLIGSMSHGVVRAISDNVDKKSKKYQEFRNRTNALGRLTNESERYRNLTEPRIKQMIGVDCFDDEVGSISDHMKDLFKMNTEQIHAVIIATQMIKSGKIPTYIDFSTSDKQEIAKRANIPAEHVFKVLQHIPDVCIDPKQISIFDVGA